MLTGRYGNANGVLHLNSDLNTNEKTIASILKSEGYQTAMSGKWHIKSDPKEMGFDFCTYFRSNGTYYGRKINDQGRDLRTEMHCDVYCANRSVDFLNEASEKDQPFFLFHNTQLPHINSDLIWDVKEETLAKYNQAEMPVTESRFDDLNKKPNYLQNVRNLIKAADYGYPDSVALQKHTREYYSTISEIDDALGYLFSTIQDLNLLENTYGIFMSDNGWMLWEHGFTSKVLPYKPSSSVPLFILGPGIDSDVNDDLVLNIDITPTIIELAGLDIQGNIHGKSMNSVLSNSNEAFRNAFIYEGLGTYGGAWPNLTAISSEFKYIVTYEDSNLDKVNYIELYNMESDPDEVENLMGQVDYQSQIPMMEELIQHHRSDILKLE